MVRRVGFAAAVLLLGCGADKAQTLHPVLEIHVAMPSSPRAKAKVRDEGCRDDAEVCVRQAVALTRTDLPRAASLFESACAVGSQDGCANFAVMLVDGRGVAEDRDRGRALLRETCATGHDRSCRNLKGYED